MTAPGPAAPPPDPSLPGQQGPQVPGDSGAPPAASGPPSTDGTRPASDTDGPPPPGQTPPPGPASPPGTDAAPPGQSPAVPPPAATAPGPAPAGQVSPGPAPAGQMPPGPPAGSEPQVPGPPPGPGVAPPFAAPPTEGGRSRLWLGLGAGALALLLCCGGGGTALVGLLVSGVQAIEEQGRTASGDYYRALAEGDYGRAYDQLCEEARQRESRQEFERRAAAEPQIVSYRVGEVDTTTLTVPVDVTYRGGGQERQQVVLAQDQQTGGMEVCGVN